MAICLPEQEYLFFWGENYSESGRLTSQECQVFHSTSFIQKDIYGADTAQDNMMGISRHYNSSHPSHAKR